MYCAAGMRYPVEEIVQKYEAEYGVQVNLQYGGSNTLLNQLEVNKSGDLYLAGDSSYIRLAEEKGLTAEAFPLALMKPVIAVQVGNPKNIKGIDDLTRDDVKVALGDPDAAAVGKKTCRGEHALTNLCIVDIGRRKVLTIVQESQAQRHRDAVFVVPVGHDEMALGPEVVVIHRAETSMLRQPCGDGGGVFRRIPENHLPSHFSRRFGKLAEAFHPFRRAGQGRDERGGGRPTREFCRYAWARATESRSRTRKRLVSPVTASW